MTSMGSVPVSEVDVADPSKTLLLSSTPTSMAQPPSPSMLRFAIPKGRMQDNVVQLLQDAGVRVVLSARGYRPSINLPNCDVKLLKPQNIVEMLQAGSRDVGFGGADWVEELQATKLVQLLDTYLDPVHVVAAGPGHDTVEEWIREGRRITIASEYEGLTRRWIIHKQMNATFVRAYGAAADCFPPEDADLVVDSAAPNSTWRDNSLTVLDVLFMSSTRLYANADALSDPVKYTMIHNLVLLARQMVMVTFNASTAVADALINSLPCMTAPTVSNMHGGTGLAVSVCVDRRECPTLLPQLNQAGAVDIIVARASQIVA